MSLRLSEEESEALRRTAETEGRTMQDVARAAIRNYVGQRDDAHMHALFARLAERDQEILERLGR
jgi:predicted DNA-binding protein